MDLWAEETILFSLDDAKMPKEKTSVTRLDKYKFRYLIGNVLSSSIPHLSGTLFHVVDVSARFRLFSLVYGGYEHRQSRGRHVELAKMCILTSNLSLAEPCLEQNSLA